MRGSVQEECTTRPRPRQDKQDRGDERDVAAADAAFDTGALFYSTRGKNRQQWRHSGGGS
jgi:hypothetical protein